MKILNKLLFFILLISFGTGYIFAQENKNYSGGITGKLIDINTEDPVEYVIVNMFTKDSVICCSQVTDVSGRFNFKNIAPGTYYIKTEYISYQDLLIPDIVIKNNMVRLKTLQLKQEINELENVEVNSEKYAVEYRPDKQIINVEKQIHAEGGTVADALQTISSVQVDAAGNITLRGSSDFLLLIDGRPVITDPSVVLTQMQANNVKQIEVITNPSVKYESEGNTGIINIITKKQKLKSYEANINLMVATEDKYSGSLNLNKQIGNHQIYAGISYSDKTKVNYNRSERRSDTDPNPTENNYTTRAVIMYSADAKIGGDFNLSEKDKLSLYTEFGIWRFSRIIDSDYKDLIENESFASHEKFMNENKFIQSGLHYEHIFNEEHKLNADINYHIVRNNVPDLYDITEQNFYQEIINDSKKNSNRVKLDYSLPLNKKHTFDIGILYKRKYSDYDYSYVSNFDQSISSQTYSYDEYAGYFLYSVKFKNMNLQLGIRAENDNRDLKHENMVYEHNQFNLFPSVHLSRSFNKKHYLTLAYSKRINRPGEWQLSPLINSSDHYLTLTGNPNLLSEFTQSGELNYHYRGKIFNTGVQVYYRSVKDQISNFVLYNGNQFFESYDNLDKSSNAGIEMSMGYQATKRLSFQLVVSSYYSDWEGMLSDGNYVSNKTTTTFGNFRSTLLLGKQTYIQFLAVYYAPGNTYQGIIDDFYYFDFIIKQHFFKKKMSITLRTHNTFDTGLLHYTVKGEGYFTENRYRYEGPTAILSLSYTLNNFKRKRTEKLNFEFDSGLDH